MGFSWDFSGTTLIKRLCKSLLKKKLGELLLGDIDLDQLDVQLTKGTLHLSDLALNADFINEKLIGSPVMIKEGSLRSLSIKIPLKLKSCEIEVEELELIVAPCTTTDIPISSSDCSTSSCNTEPQQAKDPQKADPGYASFNTVASSRDVDEGVKRIANAVKWFLTSFHIRINNIYIVFDPSTNTDLRNSAVSQALVLRIKETEFGTCLSEDASVKLNNFMKFKEAVLEFLQLDQLDKSNNSIGDITTPVLKGPIGGFSGTLNLSIPWKNGSLSLQKLDAEVSIDALELNVRPSTVDWALASWKSLQNNLASSRSNVHKGMDLSAFSSRLNMNSAGKLSKVEVPTPKVQEKMQDEFIKGTHLIQNWMPKLSDKDEQGAIGSDYDDDASIDQFFECFEGMRSSQMELGNSGIWNWTCSVFNAITFANTLASGVNHLPPDQLTEKTVHASISEICIIIYFDERRPLITEGREFEFYTSCFSSMHPDQSSMTEKNIDNIKLDHLEARFQEVSLDVETYPQNLKLKASFGQASLDEFYDARCYEKILLTPQLKRNIQYFLPPVSFDESDAGSHGTNSKIGLVRVSLLKSFGKCNCTYATSSTGSDSNSTTASLAMSLPPFTFWVHLHLLHMLIKFLSRVESSLKKSTRSTRKDVAKFPVKNELSNSTFKCRIVLPPSRIFLCFQAEFNRDISHPSSFEKFIVVDHFYPLNSKELEREMSGECPTASSSGSVHLDVRNLDAYLIEPCNQTFSATKIISTINLTGEHGFGINFNWQTGRVMDPWILSRAWGLATLHNQKSMERAAGKGSGFSSSTSLGNLHDMCSNIRQELILSTQSLLHVKLSRVLIDLSKKHYALLLSLIDQAVGGLLNTAVNTDDGEVEEKNELISDDDFSFQTSFFLECGTLDVCAQLDEVIEVSHLLQRELKGSWKGLKLCLKDFELLSVSNLGGVKDARFMWVNHGEGKLWGSMVNQPQISDIESGKDFLLVVCTGSASGRGDGLGTNALSWGKAGISFVNIFNSNSLETYTSIIVCCGTLVAPGGRLDWINAIILFFSRPSQEVEESSTEEAVNSHTGTVGASSFYLDLVDVALSYEPHVESPAENTENSSLGPSFFFESDEEMEKQCVACLLTASSLSLSNTAMSNSSSVDHDIHLQDLGLLICESDGSEICAHGCNPDYLRRVGYVRVAQNILIAAALRTSGSFWKLEMSDSSFNICVCHDTLFGLVRLASQLQQIYAPDMQDAVAHLQSRWNSLQLKKTDEQIPSHSGVSENENEILSASEAASKAGGLLDEIVENAFYAEEKNGPFDYYAVNLPYEDAAGSSEGEYISSFSPEIIETYCSPDFPSSLARNRISTSLHEDVNRGIGGWYGSGSLNIVEDHISEARSSTEGESSDQGGSYYFDTVESVDVPFNLKAQVALTKIDVSLRMFAGDDWSDRSKESPSCSSHNNGRDGDSCLELVLSGLDLCYDMYPDDEIRISKMCVSAQEMNLFDRSKNAPWKMVLGRYSSKDYPRESCSKAFKLELESIRPEPPTPLEDYRLQLEILPLRLHLDQGQLNFLVNFFRNDPSSDPDSSGLLPHDSNQLETSARESTSSSGSQAIVEEALLPFFQKFDVRPLVVRVDYIPRQFDPVALSRGNYAEILNLVPWKGIDLKLKSVSAVGVYGWGSICETVLGEWLEDISHNQVHKLLKGLPPIRSLFAVSSGTSKLVSLPIKSYKKDGKLLKGMQRGAVAFIRSISIEAVGLGVHLAAGAHEILLKTECILTAVPPTAQSDGRRRKPNVRSNQPEDAQQGIQQAYESLTEGLGRTASAIIRTPLKVYQRGAGAGSALATAFRSTPGAVIAPISASAGAVHYALLGLRNSLDPEHKRESMDKYLGPSQL
ncbi:Autophagy-related protein 2 [Rhynchospora pubera]|uniref:Autophagy-related protein 2 n=1 Tax=Rhynchospora pubera TaxID=906938 RepID=A0AAV8HLI3_9POAL|nr:Autophagy-related protein 2 [Rhynchospora pubera]